MSLVSLEPGTFSMTVQSLIHYTTEFDDEICHFTSIYFTCCKNQLTLEKNYRLSNQFWLYQHGVRNASFQRQSHLKYQILIWVTLYLVPILDHTVWTEGILYKFRMVDCINCSHIIGYIFWGDPFYVPPRQLQIESNFVKNEVFL